MRPRQNDGLIAFWRAWKQRRRGVDFEELTRPHIDALWRTALRMTGDRGSADEITQETCLRAYRSFDGFEPGTNCRAWIFRILVNLCLDHARRGKRSPLVETEIEALPAQDSLSTSREDSPEALLARKRTRQSVHQAMEELSPEIRAVVSLALLEERSYQEIPEVLGCPIGTVRSRLSRGRRQLREILRDHLPNRVVPLERSRNG